MSAWLVCVAAVLGGNGPFLRIWEKSSAEESEGANARDGWHGHDLSGEGCARPLTPVTHLNECKSMHRAGFVLIQLLGVNLISNCMHSGCPAFFLRISTQAEVSHLVGVRARECVLSCRQIFFKPGPWCVFAIRNWKVLWRLTIQSLSSGSLETCPGDAYPALSVGLQVDGGWCWCGRGNFGGNGLFEIGRMPLAGTDWSQSLVCLLRFGSVLCESAAWPR